MPLVLRRSSVWVILALLAHAAFAQAPGKPALSRT